MWQLFSEDAFFEQCMQESRICSGNECKPRSLTAWLKKEEGGLPEAADGGRGTSVPGTWRAVWRAVCR